MPDADTDTMFDVSNYLYWANLSGLNLKFKLTADDINMITASVNTSIWNKYLASKEQVELPAYELMQ
jgi:hypothetical protein